MNRNKIKQIYAAILFIAGSLYAQAQNPPHPNGGVEPGSGNTVVGGQQGGAPIGSGTILMIGMAGLYAVRKTMGLRSKKTEKPV